MNAALAVVENPEAKSLKLIGQCPRCETFVGPLACPNCKHADNFTLNRNPNKPVDSSADCRCGTSCGYLSCKCGANVIVDAFFPLNEEGLNKVYAGAKKLKEKDQDRYKELLRFLSDKGFQNDDFNADFQQVKDAEAKAKIADPIDATDIAIVGSMCVAILGLIVMMPLWFPKTFLVVGLCVCAVSCVGTVVHAKERLTWIVAASLSLALAWWANHGRMAGQDYGKLGSSEYSEMRDVWQPQAKVALTMGYSLDGCGGVNCLKTFGEYCKDNSITDDQCVVKAQEFFRVMNAQAKGK